MRNTMPTETRTVPVVLPFARKPTYSTWGRSARLTPLSEPKVSTPPEANANALDTPARLGGLHYKQSFGLFGQ